MPRTLAQPPKTELESESSRRVVGYKPLAGLRATFVNDRTVDCEASMPCIVYECSSDFTVTKVTANAFELIGIRPENFVGNRAFWEERLLAEDRDRLVARLNQLPLNQVASQIHKVADDRGLPVWVAHSFRKLSIGADPMVSGCMVSLPNDLCVRGLDPAVIAQFIHKIGNHFQLMNLLIGSLKRSGANLDEMEALQQTIDRSVEFTRSFSHYSESLGFSMPVDLAEVLRSVNKSMGPAFIEKDIAFKENIEQSLDGAVVAGDAFLLELAFRSILQNAVEATRSGDQIIVKGKGEMERLNGRSIARIAIADTGCGMETAALAKAADPFITSKRDRDGLGLSTAVRIVQIHGGTVSISSAPGQGTEVEILLPVADTPG